MKIVQFFTSRYQILRINITNTFQIETAYPSENWGNILSTTVYVMTFVLLLNIIFANINSLAGYSKNEMYLFTLVGEVAFHVTFVWSFSNLVNLIDDVRKGNFDLLLAKPLNTLFYVCTRKISILAVIRDGLIPYIFLAAIIDWKTLHLSLINVFLGFIIFIAGTIAIHTMQFFLALPVFFMGQSQGLLDLAYSLSDHDIPLQGFPLGLRVLFMSVIPVAMNTSAVASVLLNKSNPVMMTLYAISLAGICLTVRSWAWSKALAGYSSASS